MEFPPLLRSKKSSQRARPAEDTEYANLVHHRFSRAYGVLGLAKRSLRDKAYAQCGLESYKQDCLNEVIDALASDPYRAFMEREFGVRFRLHLGQQPTLYAAKDEGLMKLEDELTRRYDRRAMEHGHAFGFGMLTAAFSRFSTSRDATLVYDPPVQEGSDEIRALRAIMADYPTREDLQERHKIRLGFLTPKRVTMHRQRASAHATLGEQLILERHLPGT